MHTTCTKAIPKRGRQSETDAVSVLAFLVLVKPAKVPRPARGGGGGGQGGQNTRGPECSEGPGNLGKMFVSFIIALCLS